MKYKKLNNYYSQQGQVLLVIVMLLATVLTIVMTASLSTATQTQLTKDQEEAVKVRAAAESALDLALAEQISVPRKKFSEYPSLNRLFNDINVNQSYVGITNPTGSAFVSPLVEQDSQYSFYLSDYNNGTFSNPFSTTVPLKVLFGNSNTGDCTTMVLEFTVISGNSGSYTVNRYIADLGNKMGTENGDVQPIATSRSLTGVNSLTPTTFYCQATLPTMPANSRLLFVRTLYGASRLGFEAVGVNLNAQGRSIQAVAKSNTGVTKTLQLFQSYPQLPATLFVTSF